MNQETDKPVPSIKVFCDVLAGCLQCKPKAGRTDATGQISFEVSRPPGFPPTGDEGLVVSTLEAAQLINNGDEVGKFRGHNGLTAFGGREAEAEQLFIIPLASGLGRAYEVPTLMALTIPCNVAMAER